MRLFSLYLPPVFGRRALLAAWALLALPGGAMAANEPPPLPDANAWVRHAREDLLPWWTAAGARGQPEGRFPTFRCHDGRPYDAAAPCHELAHAPDWIRPELGRDYVRMQARQVFAYGMGFHLTGDPALLRLAEAGVRDIRSRALDPATGSPVTYWQDGRGHPAIGERTAQDVAYAGSALAVWYYLTRDPGTLADLDRLHRHLMGYFDPARGMMRWTPAGPEAGRAELVAQLDPLNAYMILVTPLLPAEMKARWQADMRRLAGVIRTRFCDQPVPHCAGTLDGPDAAAPGARHNDFGHSGKAFWMVWLAAEQTGDAELAVWARDKGRAVLAEAYLPDSGSWARRWTASGVQRGNDWWIYAELDQLAGTLAQRERGHAAYLRRTGAFWLRHYVERGLPEVWSSVSASGAHYPGDLRQHHWKNGYHAMEHALVGAITAQALAGRPVRLHYAATVGAAPVPAYFFGGEVVARKTLGSGPAAVLQVDIRLPPPADSPDPVVSRVAEAAALPGAPVALTAENAASLLPGDWRGQWVTEGGEAEGAFRLQYDRIENGMLYGSWTAEDTGMDDRLVREVPFAAPVRFEAGEMLVPAPDDTGVASHYTLFRQGATDTLRWVDRSRKPAVRLSVSRTR